MALNDFITAAHPLTRSTSDRKVAGVCGGIAKRYDVDASIVRLGFVIATVAGGIGLPLYVVAALVVPTETSVPPAPSTGTPAGGPSLPDLSVA